MNFSSTHRRPWVIGIALIIAIFLIEYFTGFVIGSVAYILIILYLVWLSRNTKFLASVGIMLTVFVISTSILLYSETNKDPDYLINKFLSLIVVWAAVYFAWRFKILYDQQQTKVNQLNAIFENANEGILFCRRDGRIILVNSFLEKLLGYHPGELLFKDIASIIPERFRENHLSHFADYFSKPQNLSMGRELWALCKTGKEVPVEINLTYFYSNTTLTVIAFITDATLKFQQKQQARENLLRVKNYNILLESRVKQRTKELEELNQSLKKSQDLYRSISENFPDGFIGVLDKDKRYVLIDGTVLGQLGFKKHELIGQRIFDDLNLSVTLDVEHQLEKVYKGEKISFDFKLFGRDFNISAAPLNSSEKKELCEEILVVVKDISSRKRFERSLMKTVEKEKELSSLKSRFVSMASHEFRTPLSTILSSVFLLENYKGEQLQKESTKLFDRIKRSSHQMLELLDEFLSTGKLEDGKLLPNPQTIDLIKFMEEIRQEFMYLRKDSQLLEMAWEGEIRDITTDQQMLKHVIMNLISNAIKYSPSESTIKVTMTFDANELIIKIKDQGIGIPVEERKFIFKRFFRAHNATGIQGTGLGLNIARRYVKLLEGNINFISSENKGTTFIVTLPLVNDLVRIN